MSGAPVIGGQGSSRSIERGGDPSLDNQALPLLPGSRQTTIERGRIDKILDDAFQLPPIDRQEIVPSVAAVVSRMREGVQEFLSTLKEVAVGCLSEIAPFRTPSNHVLIYDRSGRDTANDSHIRSQLAPVVAVGVEVCELYKELHKQLSGVPRGPRDSSRSAEAPLHRFQSLIDQAIVEVKGSFAADGITQTGALESAAAAMRNERVRDGFIAVVTPLIGSLRLSETLSGMADGVVRSIIVGRNAKHDVVIPSNLCSSTHCSIRIAPEGVILSDIGSNGLGSTNGTFVSDRSGEFKRVAPDSPVKLHAERYVSLGEPGLVESGSASGIAAIARIPSGVKLPREVEPRMMLRSVVDLIEGGLRGAVERGDGRVYTIGRVAECTLSVRNDALDPIHLSIVRRPGGDWEIREGVGAGPTQNGFALDGKIIQDSSGPTVAAAGSVVTLPTQPGVEPIRFRLP